MKKFKIERMIYKFNLVHLLSLLIVLGGILIAYLILIPKNKITIYSANFDINLLNTLETALQAREKLYFTEVEYVTLLEKSDKGLKPSFLELNESITEENIEQGIEEMLFVEYLVKKSPDKAKDYVQARISNQESVEWKNLVEYAKASSELSKFEKNKDKIKTDKENQEIGKKIIEEYKLDKNKNQIVLLNGKYISNILGSKYALVMTIVKHNLDNPRSKVPFTDKTRYQGLYPAYSNKDCNDKIDKYGILKSDDNQKKCEYTEAPVLKVQLIEDKTSVNTEEYKIQVSKLSNLVAINLKNVQEDSEPGELTLDLRQVLELSEDTKVILKLSTEIEKSPIFTRLKESGIIKEYNNNYYLILQ